MSETKTKRRPTKPLTRRQVAEILGRSPERISVYKTQGKLLSYSPEDVGRFIFGEIQNFMDSGLKKRR